MRIALFVTCVNDSLLPGTGQAVVRVLERLGHRVEFPMSQTCCGQLHVNTGYEREAVPLMRNFVDSFRSAEVVVVPSGSCAAMVRHHYPAIAGRLAGEPGLRDDVEALGSRVFELSELLVDVLGVVDVGASFAHRVTYHPTCHSLRALSVGDRPLRLLRAVADLELVELGDASECCGFGGTFALKNAEVSTAMVSDKVRCVVNSGAEVLSATDNSCLLHIGGALSRLQAGVRTAHLAEILASTAADPS